MKLLNRNGRSEFKLNYQIRCNRSLSDVIINNSITANYHLFKCNLSFIALQILNQIVMYYYKSQSMCQWVISIHSHNVFSINFTYAISIQNIPTSNNQTDTLIDRSTTKLILKIKSKNWHKLRTQKSTILDLRSISHSHVQNSYNC